MAWYDDPNFVNSSPLAPLPTVGITPALPAAPRALNPEPAKPVSDPFADLDAAMTRLAYPEEMDTTPSGLAGIPENTAPVVTLEGINQRIANKPEAPWVFGGDTLSAAKDYISNIPTFAKSAFYRLTEDDTRPDQYSPGAKAAFEEEARAQQQVEEERLRRERAGESTQVGSAIREAIPSSGFSLGSMGAAAAAGIPAAGLGTLAAGPVGGIVGGISGSMAGSGAAAYRMQRSTFLEDSFKAAEDKSLKENGRSLNEPEKQQLYNELLPLANDSALWEAGPEAIGNAATLVGGGIALKLLGKGALSQIAGGAMKKAAIRAGAATAGVATELGTETATQKGQALADARRDAVLEGKPIDEAVSRYDMPGGGGTLQAFKDVVAPTLGTMVMFGLAGGAVKGGTKAYERIVTNPREAEEIVKLSNDPNIVSALPDSSLKNLSRMSEWLGNQWFQGPERKQLLDNALIKLNAEITNRESESGEIKAERKKTLQSLWDTMGPQEQLGVLGFLQNESVPMTGWVDKEGNALTDKQGRALGEIDVRGLAKLAPVLGLSNDVLQKNFEKVRGDWYARQEANKKQQPNLPVDDYGSEIDPKLVGATVPITSTSQSKQQQKQQTPLANLADAVPPTSLVPLPIETLTEKQKKDHVKNIAKISSTKATPEERASAESFLNQFSVVGSRPMDIAFGAKQKSTGVDSTAAPPIAPIEPNIADPNAVGKSMLDEALARQQSAQTPPVVEPTDTTATQEAKEEQQPVREVPKVVVGTTAVPTVTSGSQAIIQAINDEAAKVSGTPSTSQLSNPSLPSVPSSVSAPETPVVSPNTNAELPTVQPVVAPVSQNSSNIPSSESGILPEQAGSNQQPEQVKMPPVAVTPTPPVAVTPVPPSPVTPTPPKPVTPIPPQPKKESADVVRSQEGRQAETPSLLDGKAPVTDPQTQWNDSTPEQRKERLLAVGSFQGGYLKQLTESEYAKLPEGLKPKLEKHLKSIVNQKSTTAVKEEGNAAIQGPKQDDNQPKHQGTGERLGTGSENREQPPEEQGSSGQAGRSNQPEQGGEKQAVTPEKKKQTVVTPNGNKIDTEFEVVELDDLITSDRPEFPSELQPRNRSRVASEKQVNKIASKLDPEQLAESRLASDGAPIIGTDQVVESGNGRVMAVRRVYSQSHLADKAAEYRKMIESRGFDTTGMKQPVLVRRRTTNLSTDERKSFTVDANTQNIAGLSPSERAIIHAGRLTTAILDLYQGGDLFSVKNSDFVRAFLDRVALNESSEMTTKDGLLNKEGVNRITNAIIAKAYNNIDFVDSLLESQDDNIKSLGGALLDVAPGMVKLKSKIESNLTPKDLDITSALVEAAQLVSRVRREGKFLKDLLNNESMFGDGPSPLVERIVKLFFSDESLRRQISREKIVYLLNSYLGYANEVKMSDPLFADVPSVTVNDIVKSLEDKKREGNKPVSTGSLFSGNAPSASGTANREEVQGPGDVAQGKESGTTELGESKGNGEQQQSEGQKQEVAPVEPKKQKDKVAPVKQEKEPIISEKEQEPKESSPPTEASKKESNYGKSNTVFTEDAAAKARALLKKKLGQLNSGLDPELVQAGITLAGYHVEAGARGFAAYAKAMLDDLGDAVRPFLRSWYEALRYYPGFDSKDMTPLSEMDQVEKNLDTIFNKGQAKQQEQPKETTETQVSYDTTVDKIISDNGILIQTGNRAWSTSGTAPTVFVDVPRGSNLIVNSNDVEAFTKPHHFDKDTGFYYVNFQGNMVFAAGPFRNPSVRFIDHVYKSYLGETTNTKEMKKRIKAMAKKMVDDVEYRKQVITEGLAYAIADSKKLTIERGPAFTSGTTTRPVRARSETVLERLRGKIRGLTRSANYISKRVAAERQLTEDNRRPVSRGTVNLISRGLAKGMPQQVIDWQIDDIAKALTNYRAGKPAFMLSADPGSGKTFTLGGFMREVLAEDPKARILYFTNSNTLIDQIRNQDLPDYGVNDGRVDIITYSRIQNPQNATITHSDGKSLIEIGDNQILVDDNTILVFDEAHKVKNILDSGEGARNASELMQRAKFTLYSSATPFETVDEAEYLANSGMFEEYDELAESEDLSYKDIRLTGFKVWAIEHGADLSFQKGKDGSVDQISIRWPNAPRFSLPANVGNTEKIAAIREFEAAQLEFMVNQFESGREARQWFIQRNLLTHRPISLGTLKSGEQASVTHLTPVAGSKDFYDNYYNVVVGIYDTALADDSEEAQKLRPTILMQRENIKKRMAEIAKLEETANLVKKDLSSNPDRKALVFVKVKAPLEFGKFKVWDDVDDATGEKRILKKIDRLIAGKDNTTLDKISNDKYQGNKERSISALKSLKDQLKDRRFDSNEISLLESEWSDYLGAMVEVTKSQNGVTWTEIENQGMFSGYSRFMAKAFMDAGMSDLRLDSPVQILENLLAKDFGNDSIVGYNGSLSEVQNVKNREAWKQERSGPRIMIATMDKGGTGLSLQDTTGNRPTFQYNVAIPYTATEFEQVSGRIARYGLQSQANVYWLFANDMPDQFDFRWAKILQERLYNQQGLVKGDVSDTAQNLNSENVLGENKEGNQYSIGDNQEARNPLTVEQARAEVATLIGENQLAAMEKLGKITFHAVNPTNQPNAQAFVDEKGNIHFVVENIRGNFAGIALHEDLHLLKDKGISESQRKIIRLSHAVLALSGLKNFVGDASYDELVKQAHRMAEEGNPHAVKALAKAKEVYPSSPDSEFVNYLVEYAPAHIPFVRRVMSKIRAVLYRMGIKVELRPEDLRELALSAFKQRANQVAKAQAEQAKRIKQIDKQAARFEGKYGPAALQDKRAEVLRSLEDDTTQEEHSKKVLDALKFSFAGETAKTADLTLLQQAKLRVNNGEDVETVRQETGWFKGKDNKWRFEIDDSNLEPALGELAIESIGEFRRSFEPKKLCLFFQQQRIRISEERTRLVYSAIFEAYPELRDMLVVPNNGNKISYVRDENKKRSYISVGINYFKDSKDLSDVEFANSIVKPLLHETQHAIQQIELFSEGGIPYSKEEGPIRQSRYYRQLAEIEARDTTNRMKLTKDQRRLIPPYQDTMIKAGIRDEDIIVNKPTTGKLVAYSIAPSELPIETAKILGDDSSWNLNPDLQGRVVAALRNPLQTIKVGVEKARPVWLGLLDRQMLVEMIENLPGVGPIAIQFQKTARKLDAMKQELKQKMYPVAEALAEQIARSRDKGYKFSRLLYGSTLHQVDPLGLPPDPAFVGASYDEKQRFAEKEKWYKIVKGWADELERENPALFKLYKEMRANYDYMLNERFNALMARLGRSSEDVVTSLLDHAKSKAEKNIDPMVQQLSQLQRGNDKTYRMLKTSLMAVMPQLYPPKKVTIHNYLNPPKAPAPQPVSVIRSKLDASARPLFDAMMERLENATTDGDLQRKIFFGLMAKAEYLTREQGKPGSLSLSGKLASLYKANPKEFDALQTALSEYLSKPNSVIKYEMVPSKRNPNVTIRTISVVDLQNDPLAVEARANLSEEAQKLFVEAARNAQDKIKESAGAIKYFYETAMAQGPYANLMRYGKYEIYSEKEGEKLPIFAKFEDPRDQKRAALALQAEGWTVNSGYQIENRVFEQAPTGSFVGNLIGFVDDVVKNEQEKATLKDDINQLYLASLPDMSASKHFMHRKGIPGFSQDALRGYAQFMNQSANAIARLNFSDIMIRNLRDLKKANDALGVPYDEESSKMQAMAGAVIEELNNSYEWQMNPTNSTLANRITRLGFFWYLTNFSTALINMSQVPLMTFPDLAARYGAKNATSEIMRTVKDYGKWKFNWGEGKKKAEEAIDARFDGDMGRMLQFLEKTGAKSRTETVSLAGMGEEDAYFSSNPVVMWANKFAKALSFPFQQSEIANREISAIAAYTLARQEAKDKTPEDAHQYAQEIAYNTVFRTQNDFSNANRARYWRSDLARILLLFKSYAKLMTWRQLRDAHQAFKEIPSNLTGEDKARFEEEKQIAKHRLAYMGAASLVFGGAMGFPLYTIFITIANAFFGNDPDDPYDVETEVNQALQSMAMSLTNNEQSADLIRQTVMKGPVGALMGSDLSPRLSLDLARLWFRKIPEQKTGEQWGLAALQQAAGPVFGGMFIGAAKGTHDIIQGINQGNTSDVSRGVEGILPAPARNAIKTWRYLTQGVETRRGDKIVDDLSAYEAVMQAIGFAPARVADQYDRNAAMMEVKGWLDTRRKNLINGYVYAVENQDYKKANEFMKDITEFNVKNPSLWIKQDSLIKAMKNRERVRANSNGGLYIPSKGMRARLEEERY